MFTLSRQQVRLFRLHAHHLDGVDGHGAGDDLLALGVGADHVRLGHGNALDVQGFHLGRPPFKRL